MLITHVKVHLVIITSKDLLTYVFVSLPLKTISMIMLKNAVKKKLWENQKKQNNAHVSHSFKISSMFKNKWKKLAKPNYISKGLTLT